MTNGYELIVPLMLVTAISFVTIKTFDPHSIFTRRLAERGELLSHHKDKTGNYNLVVVDLGKYIGLVSRTNVFNAYRKILLDVSQED